MGDKKAKKQKKKEKQESTQEHKPESSVKNIEIMTFKQETLQPSAQENSIFKSPKKKRKSDVAFDSPKKKSKVDTESEDEAGSPKKKKKLQGKGAEDLPNHENSDAASTSSKETKKMEINGWPQEDVQKLIQRISSEASSHAKSLKCQTGPNKVKWDKVVFDKYTVEDCRKMWTFIDSNQRKYRLFSEILADASEWIKHPYSSVNNFNKAHPDRPKQPLSSYFLFHQKVRDKIREENPDLKAPELAKVISQKFKDLSEKKKKKYEVKALKLREQYKENLQKFYEEHPEAKPTETTRQTSRAGTNLFGVEKPKKPFTLYLEDKMSDVAKDPDFDKNAFTERFKEKWKNLSDKKKLKWISAAHTSEVKYRKAIQDYNTENDASLSAPKLSVLSKDEQAIFDRSRGKPTKPPVNAYGLYCSKKMSGPEFAHVPNTDKMAKLANIWNNMPGSEKDKYKEEVKQLQKQYEKDLAAFLETLPPEEKSAALEVKPKRKKKAGKETSTSGLSLKAQRTLDSMVTSTVTKSPVTLLAGEPAPPPTTELELFMRSQKEKNPKVTNERLLEMYEDLSEQESAALTENFKKQRRQYYTDYEQFLDSLDPNTLKMYMQKKTKESAASLAEDEQDTSKKVSTNHKVKDSDGSDSDDDSDDSEESDSGKDHKKVTSPKKEAPSAVVSKNTTAKESSDDEDSDEEDSQKTTQILTQVVKKLPESSDSESDSDSDDSDSD